MLRIRRGGEERSPFVRSVKPAEAEERGAAPLATRRELSAAPMFEEIDEEQDGSPKRIMLVAACAAVDELVIALAMHERGAQKQVGVTVPSVAAGGAGERAVASALAERGPRESAIA